MLPGELTEEEYRQLVVLPNKARTRAEMDRISQARSKNFQNQQKRKRRKRAGFRLFDEED